MGEAIRQRVPIEPGFFTIPDDPGQSPRLLSSRCRDCGEPGRSTTSPARLSASQNSAQVVPFMIRSLAASVFMGCSVGWGVKARSHRRKTDC